jgi:Chemotaxis protein histidine kinase and related kinases
MLREKSLWEMLEERGVNVKRALLIMKGNEEAYKRFLAEFFEDPDFVRLGEAIRAKETQNAFTYAHGLKGMAANLGLDRIYEMLDMLVEILRSDKLEGAQEIYDTVMQKCDRIAGLL